MKISKKLMIVAAALAIATVGLGCTQGTSSGGSDTSNSSGTTGGSGSENGGQSNSGGTQNGGGTGNGGQINSGFSADQIELSAGTWVFTTKTISTLSTQTMPKDMLSLSKDYDIPISSTTVEKRIVPENPTLETKIECIYRSVEQSLDLSEMSDEDFEKMKPMLEQAGYTLTGKIATGKVTFEGDEAKAGGDKGKFEYLKRVICPEDSWRDTYSDISVTANPEKTKYTSTYKHSWKSGDNGSGPTEVETVTVTAEKE